MDDNVNKIFDKALSLQAEKLHIALALLSKYTHQKYDADDLLIAGVIGVIEARGMRIEYDAITELWNTSNVGRRGDSE